MDLPSWAPTFLILLVNVATVAYFAGNVNARLAAIKQSIDELKGTDSKIAVIEQRIETAEEKIDWGTQMFDNHGRQILALARGERLPPDAPLGTARRRSAR